MVRLVGILNVTPDSFSDGGMFAEPGTAVEQGASLFSDGAALVDIGAESTRPHATPVSETVEWQRLEPVLQVLILRYPGKISLDTRHPGTVRKAFEIGPVVVNDVTGMNNPEMRRAVTDLHAQVIISHLPGTNIQQAHTGMPVRKATVVKRDLLARAEQLQHMGLSKTDIILDPGIGFGKTMELNHELLKFAELVPDYEVMIGYSRKRFLGENRMDIAVNIEAGKIAITHGAAYVRVHDVAGHAGLMVP